ncbi:MAG TPA: hypothetical protein HPQ04_01480 [Rhodospirillaceae bacterium]|nr:hypothetical protein [Rhodospirillaceae bacterium]
MTNKPLHEEATALGPQAIDRHRAMSSLIEELEAIEESFTFRLMSPQATVALVHV